MDIGCINLLVSIISASAAIGAIVTTIYIYDRQKKDKIREIKNKFIRDLNIFADSCVLNKSMEEIYSFVRNNTNPDFYMARDWDCRNLEKIFMDFDYYLDFKDIFDETLKKHDEAFEILDDCREGPFDDIVQEVTEPKREFQDAVNRIREKMK